VGEEEEWERGDGAGDGVMVMTKNKRGKSVGTGY